MDHKVKVIYMDFSKAFDSLIRDLLKIKMNNTLGNWIKIIAVVPQGSMLGPLLFNIFF